VSSDWTQHAFVAVVVAVVLTVMVGVTTAGAPSDVGQSAITAVETAENTTELLVAGALIGTGIGVVLGSFGMYWYWRRQF